MPMSSVPPSPPCFSGVRNRKPGNPEIPGLLCFPIQEEHDVGTRPRGRRKRPLSPSRKSKVSRVRKTGACLRCQIRKVQCDEERPCKGCKSTILNSNSSAGWQWMDCTVLSLSEWSIYRSDLPVLRAHRDSYTEMLSSMLDEIRLPVGPQIKVTIDFLAQDFAAWITRSSSGFAASKLGLLCVSEFQVIGEGIMKGFPINDFRLLVWTTTLLHTARAHGDDDHQQQYDALCNLKDFRNWCGERVVNELDRLCRPQSIQQLTTLQQKLLFLLVIGVCLSATYTTDISSKSALSPSAPETDPDPMRHTFIRALAHVVTYLGHATNLLNSSIDSRALLDAANRRWDNKGSYNWLLPCALVEKLEAMLYQDIPNGQIGSSGVITWKNQDASDSAASAIHSAKILSENSKGTCSTCGEEFEDDFCIWCEYTTFMPLDKFPVQLSNNTAAIKLVDTRFLDSQDVKDDCTSRGDLVSNRTTPTLSHSSNNPVYKNGGRMRYNCWVCHNCGDILTPDLQPACVTCGHEQCKYCDSGFV